MFRFFTLCLMTIVALASAKPGIVSPLAYSSPLIAAAPYGAYTAGFAAPYYGSYASPYYGSYAGAHYGAPYTAGFGGYHPYGSYGFLRR